MIPVPVSSALPQLNIAPCSDVGLHATKELKLPLWIIHSQHWVCTLQDHIFKLDFRDNTAQATPVQPFWFIQWNQCHFMHNNKMNKFTVKSDSEDTSGSTSSTFVQPHISTQQTKSHTTTLLLSTLALFNYLLSLYLHISSFDSIQCIQIAH